MKSRANWNIAFEISPLLAASGSFGDKSGVYRLGFNQIKYLSEYLISVKSEQQIYLYTLQPPLQYNMSLDLFQLLQKPNIQFMYGPFLKHALLRDRKIFDHFILRFVAKKVDKYFYQPLVERILFARYVSVVQKMLIRKKIKVVHHSESGFVPYRQVANIIHINDVIPFLFPFWQRKKAVGIHDAKVKFANRYCQGVICISENTKKDFIKLSKAPKFTSSNKPDVKVIYLGIEKFASSKESSIRVLNNIVAQSGWNEIKDKKYFLYFGTIEPRKNITSLMMVFHNLKITGKLADYKLVIMGGRGWGKIYDQAQNFIRENFPIRAESPIIMLDFLSDDHLASFIRHAYAVVYPSIYEGFGLPVIESLQFGIPVITSNTSSLPEAGGDACLYVDPKNPEELSNAIVKLARDKKLYRRLSALGIKHVKQFDWKKNAAETYKFYTSLLKRRQ